MSPTNSDWVYTLFIAGKKAGLMNYSTERGQLEFIEEITEMPEPSSTTHTMHIDHSGKVTYNHLPDKVKAPQIYG